MNVLTTFAAGQLDPLGPEETDADLSAILHWLRASKAAAAVAPARGVPGIARLVLERYWQLPRSEFHYQNLGGRRKGVTGNKLILIPWSEEAFKVYRKSRSVSDLRTEHVTPIDAIWKKLMQLLQEVGDDDCEWKARAGDYLQQNFTLAVITREQALAIDTFTRTGAFEGEPFRRYELAAKQIRVKRRAGSTKVRLNVKKFVHPAFKNLPNVVAAVQSQGGSGGD